MRSKGYELDFDVKRGDKGTVNTDKLLNNVRRAKSLVYEYAMCNDWNYFCTFTIDGKKFPRDDLKGYYKLFGQWLRDVAKKHGKITYLFIPELHKDKENWHLHGLMNIRDDLLSKFIDGIHPRDLVESNYLNWQAYEKKFGFCSFGKIKNKEAVSAYITKYILKNIDDSNSKIGLNNKLYYSSRGLKTKEEIKNGTMSANIATVKPDFENEYVSIKNLTALECGLLLDN